MEDKSTKLKKTERMKTILRNVHRTGKTAEAMKELL